MCAPIMLNFPFCKRKLVFDLFQTCTKLMFGPSDVFVVPVLARDRINGVGSLFFRDRILRFGENMPQILKMSKVFPEVSMYCKLYTKQPVLHTYSLLRTSHCNDLGVTLWMYAAGIYDEKLYRRCGGKLYKLIRLYSPLSFLLPDR